MKQHVRLALLALVALAALVAQTPQGWKMRVDRSTAASDPDAPGDIKFMAMGSALGRYSHVFPPCITSHLNALNRWFHR